MKDLFVAKVYKHCMDDCELCRFYCEGNDAIQIQKRLEEKLMASHNMEMVYVQAYKIDRDVKDIDLIKSLVNTILIFD